MGSSNSNRSIALVLADIANESDRILLELKNDAAKHGFDVTPYLARLAKLSSKYAILPAQKALPAEQSLDQKTSARLDQGKC